MTAVPMSDFIATHHPDPDPTPAVVVNPLAPYFAAVDDLTTDQLREVDARLIGALSVAVDPKVFAEVLERCIAAVVPEVTC